MSTVSSRPRRARRPHHTDSSVPPRSPVVAAPPVVHPAPPAGSVVGTASSFSELGLPAALCAVLTRQGLTEPLPIQSATVADGLAGRDVLGQASTGSGKTLAFALPLVARLMAGTPNPAPGRRRPRALVVAPTRELASQIDAVIKPLAAAAGLRSATIFGGVGAAPQLAALRAGTEIIIGCPGRLLDHLEHRALDLGGIEICVIDEADHLADVGFLPMVNRLLDATPRNGQRLLFSATLAGGVDALIRRFLRDPVSHAVSAGAPPDLVHKVLVVDSDARVDALVDLLGTDRGVIFTRTKHRAKQLTRTLITRGLNAVELHGNLSQNARTANLGAFSSGKAQVMVATDIAARGIHVDEVPLVIHADPPLEHRAYLHRSGRTARAGNSGTVVTLTTPDQIGDVKTLLRRAGLDATWTKHAERGPQSGRPPASPPADAARTAPPRNSTGPPRRTRSAAPRSNRRG